MNAVGATSQGTPPARTPVVEVRNISKVYEPLNRWMRILVRSHVTQPIPALTDISFTVGEGEVCAVVGPNGAGKSTLFRILTGLTTPTSGAATIRGFDAERESRQARRFVGFMPSDDRSLFMRHTCRHNLNFHGKLQGVPNTTLAALVDEALEMVGLGYAADRAAFALSSGMRARLQLARALLVRPKVLILDEPTGTIDPVDAHRLLQLIEQLTHEHGLAVLISSHRLEEIDALHDNVVFLDRGHLVRWGDLHSLRDMWETPRLVLRFDDSSAAKDAARTLETLHCSEVELADDAVVVAGEITAGDLLAKLDGVLDRITEVERTRMPLRDVLSRLVDSSGN
jgi:ABC-2 type transport system ATP-binding protein